MLFIPMLIPAKNVFFYHKLTKMKIANIFIYSLLSSVLLISCSKDLGNYDYHEVNKISIAGVLEGDHNAQRIYDLPFSDTLRITPTITGTLSGTDLSNVSFRWRVDGEEISNTNKFEYIANKGYGKMNADLTVTDNKTGIETSYSFFVNVINPYKLGYYVLSKKPNGESILYCKSTIREKNQFEEVLIPNISLGSNPISISGNRQYGNSSRDYYNRLALGMKNAPYPVIMVDSREFLPNLLYSKDSYVGEKENFVFEPTDVVLDPYNPIIYMVNQGKLHILQKGGISLPALNSDKLDYSISKGGMAGASFYTPYFFSFYDAKNKMIRLLDNGVSSGVSYTYINVFDEITNTSIYKDQEFVISQLTYFNDDPKFVYLMKKDSRLFAYWVSYNGDLKPVSFQKMAEGNIPGEGILRFASYDFDANYWYLATDKTIHRASYLGLEFQPFVTLPANAPGYITKYKMTEGKLMITTYDPNYAGEKKSSVYIYDINRMTLEVAMPHSVAEAVDLHIGI